MNKDVVIIGAGGHAKVIADIIVKSNDEVIGFLDDDQTLSPNIIDRYKLIGTIADCEKIQRKNPDFQFIIAIGNNHIRTKVADKYNLNYYTAIHPSTIIGLGVNIAEGTAIMANAVINSSTKIGKHCIINTGAIIEHDNIIEDCVHISPNATLCGTVNVGKLTHIGAGAIVKNNMTVCNNCIIGAGGVVVKSIEEEGTYIGIPVKKIK